MKKSILSILFICFGIFQLSSQIDTTFIEPEFSIELKLSSKPQRFFISFSQNFWLDLDKSTKDSMKLNDFQPSFGISFMYPISIGQSPFAFSFGLGMKVDNIRFKSDLVSNDSMFYYNPELTFKKQKLVLPYIYIPVEFSYNSRGEHTFRLAIGGYFGLKMRDHIKQISDDLRQKIYNIDNLEKYYYGLYMRVGYKSISININYNLSKVFVKDISNNMQTFSVGLCLSIF